MESNQSFDCGPDYQFALEGPTYEAVRNHDPDLNRKLVCRGAVFARMSPTHKELLVGDLIQLGYYVGMCGDGANDCGALKVIVLPLFVFSIDGLKQNAGSLLTPVSYTFFYALSHGTLGFALHGSSLYHFLIGGNSSTANQILSCKWLLKLPWRAKPRLRPERA